jgi:hypothetical protein
MSKTTVLLVFALVSLLASPDSANANGELRETNYSVEAGVRWFVIAIGGLIALGGIILTSMNIRTLASVDISLEKKSASMRQVSQGVVIAIVGAAVLVATMYFLPEKSSERTVTGKTIEFAPGGQPSRAKQ